MTNIYFAEIIPSHDRSKCKKQHTQRNKNISKITKTYIKCTLCQFRTGLSITKYSGGQDNQCCQCQDNKCINEHTHHRDNTLITRVFYFCCRMGMRGGTHTGFIGKKSSRHTKAHRLLNSYAKCTTCDGLQVKRTYKTNILCLNFP